MQVAGGPPRGQGGVGGSGLGEGDQRIQPTLQFRDVCNLHMCRIKKPILAILSLECCCTCRLHASADDQVKVIISSNVVAESHMLAPDNRRWLPGASSRCHMMLDCFSPEQQQEHEVTHCNQDLFLAHFLCIVIAAHECCLGSAWEPLSRGHLWGCIGCQEGSNS